MATPLADPNDEAWENLEDAADLIGSPLSVGLLWLAVIGIAVLALLRWQPWEATQSGTGAPESMPMAVARGERGVPLVLAAQNRGEAPLAADRPQHPEAAGESSRPFTIPRGEARTIPSGWCVSGDIEVGATPTGPWTALYDELAPTGLVVCFTVPGWYAKAPFGAYAAPVRPETMAAVVQRRGCGLPQGCAIVHVIAWPGGERLASVTRDPPRVLVLNGQQFSSALAGPPRCVYGASGRGKQAAITVDMPLGWIGFIDAVEVIGVFNQPTLLTIKAPFQGRLTVRDGAWCFVPQAWAAWAQQHRRAVVSRAVVNFREMAIGGQG